MSAPTPTPTNTGGGTDIISPQLFQQMLQQILQFYPTYLTQMLHLQMTLMIIHSYISLLQMFMRLLPTPTFGFGATTVTPFAV